MSNKVDASLQRLASKYHADVLEFRDEIIKELCWMTNSEIAYFYATDLDEAHLTLLGYSKGVMDACAIVDPKQVYKVSETGLWGDAIRERAPIITNDYATSDRPSKRGIPDGRVPVYRHMNMPIFGGVLDDRIVAIVGVGNKPDPYTQEDVSNVSLLMHTVWNKFAKALWGFQV